MILKDLLIQLDNTPPWFYPSGLAIWVKDNPEPPYVSLECHAGLMWPDQDDTDGWTMIAVLENEKPEHPHYSFLYLFTAGLTHTWRVNE